MVVTTKKNRQEIFLGIGGLRLLKAIGDRPDAYHMNEGHAIGTRTVARIYRKALTKKNALEDARNKCVFTTHTPVPAGHDTFTGTLSMNTLSVSTQSRIT